MTFTRSRLISVLTYIVMIIMNITAVIKPFNNISAFAISEKYSHLLTPMKYTFSIWSVIYIGLAAYLIYQYTSLKEDTIDKITTINNWFILSNIANTLWVVSYYNEHLLLSLFMMLILMISLLGISITISKFDVRSKDRLFISVPFAIYFGWITIKTIVDISTLAVSVGVDAYSDSAPILTIFVIALGIVIGCYTTIKKKIVGYGLVIIWAYIGILFNHVSVMGYNSSYPDIIVTILIGIVMTIVLEVILLFRIVKENI